MGWGCSSATKSLEISREKLRLSLFVLCWLLSVYPFLSRMITNFGASKIGEGEESVILFADWDIIQAACYTNVDRLSSAEEFAIKVLGVAGSIFLPLIVVLKLIWLAVQRQHTETKLVRTVSVRLQRMAGFWTVFLLVVLPLIAITQAWTVLRLQWLQARMADVVGNADTDGQWTFGQVVSVTLFAPVFVECWFHWRFEGQSRSMEALEKSPVLIEESTL